MYLLTKNSIKNLVFILLYIFFKIIGFIPVSLRNINFPFGFVATRRGLIYNVTLMITFLVLNFYSISAIKNSTYPNKSQVTETFELFKAIFGAISMVVLWTVISVKQRRTVIIANEIVNINDAMMKDRNIQGPETCMPQCLLLCGVNIFFWVNLIWTEMRAFEKVQVIMLVAEGPNFLFNWFLMLYSFIFILLEMRVRAINKGMLKLIKSLPSSRNHGDKINSLMALKNAHERLYEIINEIATSYSFPIFLIITELGASIIYEAYYLVAPFVVPSLEFSWWLIGNSLCCLCTQTFPIIIMTICLDRISNQVCLIIKNTR